MYVNKRAVLNLKERKHARLGTSMFLTKIVRLFGKNNPVKNMNYEMHELHIQPTMLANISNGYTCKGWSKIFSKGGCDQCFYLYRPKKRDCRPQNGRFFWLLLKIFNQRGDATLPPQDSLLSWQSYLGFVNRCFKLNISEYFNYENVFQIIFSYVNL